MFTILLVEDDLSLIDGLSFSLARQGFEVVVARTVTEARSSLARTSVDLVLLDLMLPDGSGFDLCRTIRQTSSVFVSIVGQSGAGKSTLLHLMGGLDTPTSGRVIVDGRDIYTMSEEELAIFRRRSIGFVFQTYNLVPELNVEENIILPLLLDYKKPDSRFIDELLGILGLMDRRYHLPGQLSGGQQQRAAIGRALASRPAIILADEPTGNLDSKSSRDVIDLLRLNIFNTMNTSVAAKTRYLGVMRAIGMSWRQLDRMVLAESATYTLIGVVIGCFLGVVLQRLLINYWLVSFHVKWHFPLAQIIVIAFVTVLATLLAVIGPLKKIKLTPVCEVINTL